MTLMAAGPGSSADGNSTLERAEYLVSHGKSGGFGRFIAAYPLSLKRGDSVVVESRRGLEIGTVLCPATAGHIELLAGTPAGRLLRRAQPADERAVQDLHSLARIIFADSRVLANTLGLRLEIVDVEVLMDSSSAVIQFLGATDDDFTPLVNAVLEKHGLIALMENLALPLTEPAEEHGGCGKPDCGQAEGGGGCTSCGTGGGCSSCGAGKVDMAAYFGHLRSKMDERVRTSLL
jgi:hypothetical protein